MFQASQSWHFGAEAPRLRTKPTQRLTNQYVDQAKQAFDTRQYAASLEALEKGRKGQSAPCAIWESSTN